MNAARLRVEDINAIVALSLAGFTTRSIARAYHVVPRTIADVLHERSFKWVARAAVSCPLLPIDRARRLALRSPNKLTTSEQIGLIGYANKLISIADPFTKQVHVNALWRTWKPRRWRNRRKRYAAATAVTTEATAAGSAEAAPDPSPTEAGVARR